MILAGGRAVASSCHGESTSSRERNREKLLDARDILGRKRRAAVVSSHIARSVKRAHNVIHPKTISRSRVKATKTAIPGEIVKSPVNRQKRRRLSVEKKPTDGGGKRSHIKIVSVGRNS